jgi:hypothetical protein
MLRISRLPRWQAALVLLAGLVLAAPGTALAQIGSPNNVTADPPVPRPSTTPCAVQLFSHVIFADFSPKPFTYTPPAGCPGAWAKIVLEGDFSVTAGRQFDRTAQIAVGHVNIYYGTTPEPSRTVSPTWHFERDLTDYTPLFQAAQSGEANLGNLVNSTYTGIIEGSARLLFYPASATEPAPWTADAVLPLSDAPGGAALLDTAANVLAPTFSLPRNIEAAYLDVIAQSQSSDEFWYACVPDDVAGELFSCPGTSFRETEITIDGQPAGVAPIYPWLYTGAIDPLLWRPIPSVQTLNFVPYRVDLTPFAGVLSDGQPHQVGVQVFNANHYFLVAASLLLDLDAGSTQVTGAVTENTLAAVPPLSLDENLSTAADGTVSGTVTTTSQRSFTIAGYVETSHGRVETTVRQTLSFTNSQDFLVANDRYVQNITQATLITSGTKTKGAHGTVHTEQHFSWPLILDISQVLNADGSFDQTTSVDQSFESQRVQGGPGSPHMSRVSNTVTTADTLLFAPSGAVTGFRDRASSQTYSSRDSDGACYNRTITAVDGLLTSITDGTGCGNAH